MSESRPEVPRSTFIFIFINVLMSMVGFGIIMPVMPDLLVEVTGKSLSEAASLGGWIYFSYALAQFVMSPILGGLSDRFGRRPVLLVSLLMYAFDFLLLALAPTYAWLIIARTLSGASAAIHSTANAVIADISPPEKRSANFGLMGAAFGIGFIIGPAIGGLVGELGTRAPFFAAAAVGAANFIFGLIAFPETLQKKRPFDWRRANPVGSLLSVSRYGIVLVVLTAFFLMQFAHHSLPSVFPYFAKLKFGWSPAEVGYALTFVGVTAAIVQGGLIRKLMPLLGEPRAVLLGAATMTISFLGYAFFSPSGLYIYVWIAVGALGGLMMPAMQSLMSSAVPQDGQGELQGAVSSVMSLTMMFGPVVMTNTFTRFTDAEGLYLPGAPLVLSAVLLLLSMIPFAIIVRKTGAKRQASEGAEA